MSITFDYKLAICLSSETISLNTDHLTKRMLLFESLLLNYQKDKEKQFLMFIHLCYEYRAESLINTSISDH